MQKDMGAETPQSPEDSAEDLAIAGALVEHELDPSNPTEQRTRAILQLFRALAIGKTIAVVGSGASMIYGYPDWRDLVKKLSDQLIDGKYRPREDAKKEFDELKNILIDNRAKDLKKKERKERIPEPPSDQDPVLSRDELLALCDEADSYLDDESKEKYRHFLVSLFQRHRLYYRLTNAIGSHPFRDDLHESISKLRVSDKSTLIEGKLAPESLLPADVSGLIFSLPVKGFERPDPTDLQKSELINAPRNLLDPLSELRSRVGIHRFVTFNYDLEIETLLEDIDYPFNALTRIPESTASVTDEERDQPDRFIESRLGGIAHSISLSAENAPDLISIAAIPSSASDLIVHVHGAITRPRDMVVTQSGYNAIYYEDHEFRRGFEDARRLLFGGNAVLYIGLGLTEEDLMRPLRYLSANLRNRPLFALVPLLSNENRAKAFERRIKSNYGVNVITYGRAYKDIPQIWKENENSNAFHPRRSSPSDDFISLGEELENIRSRFQFLDNESDKLGKLVSNLKFLIENKDSFPRLHSNRTQLPEIASKLLGNLNDLDPEKIGDFDRMMQTIAITVALCDALEYMQGVAITWQSRLKIESSSIPEKGSPTLDHYGAVHRARDPAGLLKIGKSFDQGIIDEHLGLEKIASGTRIFRIEPGKGRGSLFSYITEKCRERNLKTGTAEWRAINISHSIREKTILSEILASLESIRFLCLHDADSLLDEREPKPATLFLESFLLKLRKACLPKEGDHGLHLILIVRTERAAAFYSKILGDYRYGPLVPTRIAIHGVKSIGLDSADLWFRFKERYEYLANEMLKSRWAFLAVLGTMEYLHATGKTQTITAESLLPLNKNELLDNCNLALRNRLFSVAGKHHHAALCEVLLEERHRLIQRSMDIGMRNQVVVENIILKWMYAIPIAIDRTTINNIPEIVKLKQGSSEGYQVDENTIKEALLALKTYRFIFEVDYDPAVKQDSPDSRYILHGAIQQILGYRRGFSLDAPATKDHNSVSLSLMLMDGGPMLGPLDFKSTCELYDKLTRLPPIKANRIAIRSAYAMIRSTIHTQSAMRADLAEGPKEYGNSALHTHLRRLAKLRSLSIRRPKNEEPTGEHPPLLYKECELWLLNELGVVRFLQGNMHDAVFSFRECMDASNRIMIGSKSMAEMDPSLSPRLSINLALCLIERARFHDAESLVQEALNRLPKHAEENENPEHKLLWALLQGCLAQIQLLTAQLDSARGTVGKALPIIEKLGALGAQAWLHSVEASAALASEAHDEADKAISLALAAARGAHRPDLILNLELNAIDIQLSANGYNREVVLSSLSRLENLETSAIRLGSHRSRCSAMLIRARALLTIEQAEPAREAIIEAISIAQLNGMRLKRISGLILLVALMAQRGEREPAKKLLRSVKLAANRARYVRAVADIERLQQAMEIEGGVPHWAGFVSDFGSTDRRRSSLR
jgi:hypothetical protein